MLVCVAGEVATAARDDAVDARRAQLAEAAAAAAAAKAREDAIAAAAKATSSDLAAVQSALAEIRDLTLRLTVSGVAAAMAL